jgi:predicted Holliday junction resolvase-like endonuclease
MDGFEILIYLIIGFILLILAIILYLAILEIRNNTAETNYLLRKLINSQDFTTPATLKRNKDPLEENNKTKRFIDILEKADKKDEEKEFKAVEKD